MIRVGTCSWAEKTLLSSGDFYPKDIKDTADRLQYYSSQFSTVEVDSTYYAIPSIKNAFLWAQRTPGEFLFHIKVFGALTGHGIAPKTLPKDLLAILPQKDRDQKNVYIREPEILQIIARRFIDVLNPLKKAGKLGIIVFQFPPWFHYNTSHLDYILNCKDLMKDMQIGVEFRQGSWLMPERSSSVFDFLIKHRITYIIADEPQYGNLATVPFLPETTADSAYFRFHGRNKTNWLKKGIETSLRYDYLYSEEELRTFIPHIKGIDKKVKTTYAMFNNCHGGFAMRNGLRLKELLKNSD